MRQKERYLSSKHDDNCERKHNIRNVEAVSIYLFI